MIDLGALADLAEEAVAAGAAVHATPPAEVQAKGAPGDLVTPVDVEAERRACEVIRAERRHDAIVAEERGKRAGTSGVTWFVDGLDGTANFVRGYPAHAVSVGVEVNGEPAVGVVHDTATGAVYRAAAGAAATRDGRRLGVASPRPLGESVIATGFGFDRPHRERQVRVLAALLPDLADVRRSGSPALDLCRVAAGEVDGCYEIGLGPWDYAAGRVIVEAAGGRVEVLACDPWPGPLVVAGPASTVEALLDLLAAAGVPMRSGPHDPVATVAAGYDRLAGRYDGWAGAIEGNERGRLLDWLEGEVETGEPVLELGSGTGVPVAARLAARYDYLGVDVSGGMIDRARAAVPKAEFRVADMRTLDFPPGSFAAVVALYSIIHVPRLDQPALLAAIRRWLRPGGVFVATLHAGDDPAGVEDDWLGAGPMFWSGFDADANRRLLREAGLELVEAEVRTIQEPEGEARFLFVAARAR